MPFIGNQPTAVPLASSDLEDNIISTAKIQDNAVTAAKYVEPIPFRDIIINGEMSIAQRGTSTTGVTTTDGYYACDRFYTQTDTGTWTISQSTDVPTGQGFAKSLKLDCTSAGTSNADEVGIRHKIEGQNVQYLKYGTSSAESTTLSFWIKTNKTGNYSVALKNVNSTQERLVSFTYAVSSADTWEKKTITFPGDTSQALDNSNAADLEIYWYFGAASGFRGGVVNTWTNYSASNFAPSDLAGFGGSTDDEVYITGVQLEAGQTASEFEFLPVDVNLQRCLRYYELLAQGNAITFGNTNYYSSSAIYSSQKTTVPMRSTPSLEYVSGSSYYRAIRNSGNDYFNDMVLGDASDKTFELVSTSGISGTAGHSAFLRTANASAFVAISAEL